MDTRKPLHSEELASSPCTVCVTGAAGYTGCAIVSRLLEAGHTVHGTFRDGNDTTAIRALNALPGAKRLLWFQADLLVPGSFDEALRGCKSYDDDAYISPAVIGVQNVLSSVNKTSTVERVVLSSSIAAIVGNYNTYDDNYVFTEKDWTVVMDPGRHFKASYGVSKTISEMAAWAICSQQKRWSLVTICAGNCFGPPLIDSEVPRIFVESITKSSNYTADIAFPTVDLDDVAAAHVLAMVNPNANGRYLMCEACKMHADLVDWARNKFAVRRPPQKLPYWKMLLAHILPGFYELKRILPFYGKHLMTSSEKVKRELGLHLTPFEQSAEDMIKRMIEIGAFPELALKLKSS